ncbi:MAG: hypothetical protein MOB07_29575 [Acidobacteria bacterium]|nr:hypothetical protein [Acidobacteriota bacterium]
MRLKIPYSIFHATCHYLFDIASGWPVVAGGWPMVGRWLASGWADIKLGTSRVVSYHVPVFKVVSAMPAIKFISKGRYTNFRPLMKPPANKPFPLN